MDRPAVEEQEPRREDPAGGKSPPADPLYVVGIGTSSGGLAALRTLFAELPPTLGVAYVVVMHLSPDHRSYLDELLQISTSMPVRQVRSTERLLPDHIYVIPPNANLDTIDTHLRLSRLEERRIERAPIDHFLRTLASTHKAQAIGVILTGAGSDGALGIRQIKEQGGLTIAQDPGEAAFDGMPRAAIGTGTIDLILRLRDIPDNIARYCATRPQVPEPDGNDAIAAAENKLLEEILSQLEIRTGQEVSVYRRATVLGRIRRRMKLRHLDTLAGYLDLLRKLPEEARALGDELVTSVAEFFADAKLYERLETRIIPRLFDGKSGGERLRVWSLCCSTGEEAYSLAMLLLEESARRRAPPRLQVFASDLVGDRLLRAREGVYPHEVAATVSEERLERFFVDEAGQFRVRRDVRDTVIFTPQNLFKDPPFSRLDLIVCRNLLVSLQPSVRQGVVNILYHALEPNGVLVIGRDDVLEVPELFEVEDARTRVYRRRPGPAPRRSADTSIEELLRQARPATGAARAAARGDLGAIHEHLTGHFGPASLLVNERNEVVHYSPRAGNFIRMPGGEPTSDVLRLVPEPLRGQLVVGLRKVRRDAKPWSSIPLHARTDGGERRVVLRVDAVSSDRPRELVLVVFDDLRREADVAPGAAERPVSPAGPVTVLETELADTQQRLHALIEQHDDDRERYDSAERAGVLESSELRSLNEELRSILEELESSKEELQAANEELVALDADNRRRIAELGQLSGDLKHLLASTGIAMLFLDRELRIVRFTPQLGELFHVRSGDRGRPLSDLTHGLRYDGLHEDTLAVIANVEPREREVESAEGRWYVARMLPYRSPRNEVEGVVLALIDITDRKRAEDKLRLADRRKDEFLALLAHELRNPLAPIVAGVDVLKMAADDPGMVEKVAATIGRQTQQLVRLVDDLLEVSRISGGRLKLTRARVMLQDVIRDSVAAVRPIVDRAGHELSLNVTPEPIVVEGDSARLTQALGNLLNNAVRYTPRGGRISLTAKRENAEAVVIVEDNGIGIPDDILPRVFEMFYQGDNARAGRNVGLGIGLTLAKSLVEMHGGTIGVESDGDNRGSRFTIRLATATEMATEGATAELTVASGAGAHPRSRGRRVLVVDDNKDAAETLCMLLQTLGDNDVRLALNGADALRIADTQQPDIAFLDLKMPEMDGYEVARRIREQPWGGGAMLIALTGFGQEDHKRRTREAGFDRHLTKPAARAAVEAVLSEPPRAAGVAG